MKVSWKILLVLGGLCPVRAFAASEPPLDNGVGVHGPLTWGRTDSNHGIYLTPVYQGEQYALPLNLLKQVKAVGFDFVRLSVDPGPFLLLRDRELEALYAHLLTVIHQIRQTGLDVLVDFHPISMVAATAPDRIEANTNGLFDDYVHMIRRAARLLAKEGTAHIAIEPMNEPQLGYNPSEVQRWQGMAQQLVDAVRAESPDMLVVISGGRGGSLEGLFNLNTTPFDRNVHYSFHYYLPFIFTHEGVDSVNPPSRIWRYITGLPYPATPNGFDQFWPLVNARVGADQKLSTAEKTSILSAGRAQLEAYFADGGTRAAIHHDFDQVSTWASAHHIAPEQVFLGEFSATQQSADNDGANPEDRARWINDVREEAQEHYFHWSFWALYGKSASGMTLVSPANPQLLDPVTVRALGRNVP